VFWHAVLMDKEIAAGDHHGITTAAEVSCIFELFGEQITEVDNSRNDDGLHARRSYGD
jgi:hypothetical protein